MRQTGESTAAAQRLVDEAAELFERGDVEASLARAERARAAAPKFVPALHWRATALAELGRADEAREAYEEALLQGIDDVDLLVGAADFYVNGTREPDLEREWLERGLELARRGSKLARRQRDDEMVTELALLEGLALSQLGSPAEALTRLEAVLVARPDDVDAMLERGFALYELSRPEEARGQLADVLQRAPEEAWAHHLLGLIAERQGEEAEAERRFARARKLAPDDFPRPVVLSPHAFDAAVEDALRSLPDQVRSYLSNVAIAVEDLPADEDLLSSSPPLSPSILGVFRGAPLGDKASMNPWNHFPSSIVLYQKNLQRFARDQRELIEQIGVTLVHEVGHFLGLDEDDLWELGLE